MVREWLDKGKGQRWLAVVWPGIFSTALLWGGSPAIAQPQMQTSFTVAQWFYPPADPSPILRVIGKGKASLPADGAELTFEFGAPASSDSPTEPSPSFLPKVALSPVESSYEAILKALLAIGISQQNIRLSVQGEAPRKSPLPFPLPLPVPSQGTAAPATIKVKQPQPTSPQLSKIVDTVRRVVANKPDLNLTRVGVRYTLENCQALEAAVYTAAVQNAKTRATAIAEAAGAKLNPVPSIAQPFYDLIFSGCEGDHAAVLEEDDTDYDPNLPPEVKLSREIFVTYTLRP